MIDKDRFLAITDGIVAIAATIMVLQLVVPEIVTLRNILAQWPTLLAYIISFIQIFLAWHEHHDSLANAKWINHRIFLINCLWLFFITLLPFVTALVGRAAGHRYAMLIFIGVLFFIHLVIALESRAIEKLNECKIRDHAIIRVLRIISFSAYALAAVCAWFDPISGFAVILLLDIGSVVLMWIYDRKRTREIKQS